MWELVLAGAFDYECILQMAWRGFFLWNVSNVDEVAARVQLLK